MFMDPSIVVQFIQKNPTRCNSLSKFIIPYLYEAQRVSGDTAHHQEPKTALAASGLRTWKHPATTRPTTFHVCKPEAASAVLGF